VLLCLLASLQAVALGLRGQAIGVPDLRRLKDLVLWHDLVLMSKAASNYQRQHARVSVDAIVRNLTIAEESHDWNVAKDLLNRLELMGFVPK
jgi:hypothetical protein